MTLSDTRRFVAHGLIAALFVTTVAAREMVFQVGPNTRVARQADERVLVEPHLSAHPTDPGYLLGVGWVTTPEASAGGELCAVLVSEDGGTSWTRTELSGVSWADPWTAITPQGTAFLTASMDGGETFAPPVRVADELSCPDAERIGYPIRRWPTGGDYFGFAAAADGTFHLLWPDARGGGFELWTAAVSIGEPR